MHPFAALNDDLGYREWPVISSGRADDMPVVLECQNHPLVPANVLVNRVRVMLLRTDKLSMEAAFRAESKMSAPRGPPSSWAAIGLLEVEDGDYVFLRDQVEQGRATDKQQVAVHDVLAVAAAGSGIHDLVTLGAMKAATDALIGAGLDGLTDFERTESAKQIGNSRCFSLATTVEKPKKLSAPAAAGKPTPSNAQYNRMVSEVLNAGSKMVVNILKTLPLEMQKATEGNRDVVNHPTAGCFDNYMAPNVQLNISSSAGGSKELKDDLGQFGEAHYDSSDHPAYMTVLLALPAGQTSNDAGYFHLLHLGVYTKLVPYRGLVFSGRRKHVGTPPEHTLSTGALGKKEFRINAVFYPSKISVNGQGRYSMGSTFKKQDDTKPKRRTNDPDHNILFTTPEMLNVENETLAASSTNRSTYASQGHTIMDTEAMANFYGRSSIQWLAYLLRQATPDLQFSIDEDLICQSITYRNSKGVREPLKRWECAPDAHRVREARVRASRQFEIFAAKTKRFIPSVAGAGGGGKGTTAVGRANVGEKERVVSSGASHRASKGKGAGYRNHRTRKSADRPDDSDIEDWEAGAGDDEEGRQNVTRSEHTGSSMGGGDGDQRMDCNGGPMLEGWSTVDDEGSDGYNNGITSHQPIDSAPASDVQVDEDFKSTKDGDPRFRILERLNVRTLETEMIALEKEQQAHIRFDELHVHPPDMDQLRAAFAMLDTDPGSNFAPKLAKQLLEYASRCEDRIHRAHFSTRVERAQIMTASSRPWRWLELEMAGLAKSRRGELEADRRSRAPDWMDDMISVLQSGLADGRRTIVLDPSQYPRLSAFANSSYVFVNRHAPLRYVGEDEQDGLTNAVVDAIRAILPDWMGFSGADGRQDRCDRVRSWFVDALQHHLGSEFLTTDIAWTWYTSFKTGHVIRGDSIYRTYTPSRQLLVPFINALGQHPILDAATETGKSLARYKAMITGQTTAVSVSTQPHNAALEEFIDFIVLGWRVGTGEHNASISRIADAVMQRPEALMPIREWEHARLRSKSASGPYHASFIKSREGIFSALVWRGITEGSLFAREGRMQFSSVFDFQDAVDEMAHQHPEADISSVCIQQIHGRYIGSRSGSNAITLWRDVLELPSWETFAQSYPTFGECFHYFFQRTSSQDGKRRVEDIDTVSMFNVVADLAHAGICQGPTMEEVARYIVTVRGQSYKALCGFGLVDSTRDSMEETVKALSSVQEAIAGRLQWEMIQSMGLDVIGLEYALARFTEAQDTVVDT
ncbi:hypothetical protein MD484_g1557, partial [Candolleomyces efflorescens]